ncbi:MAG: cytochrome c family protein [Magnetovibrio sp.]|nr:cytochrome c family protein [Magnetovibrio sp.]
MLKKIIAASFFFGIVFAFFIILSEISVTVKNAESLKKVKVEVAKTMKLSKARVLNKRTVTVDPVKLGASLFKRNCLGCHTPNKGSPNRTGPNLWGIIDRPIGQVKNYRYSRQLQVLGGIWSEDKVSEWLAGPRAMIPETKMTFSGLKNPQDRNNIIAYLKTLKD